MTKQKPSNRETAEPTIIAIYSPDVARQVQALRLILDVQARKRRRLPGVVPTSMAVAEVALAQDEVGDASELILATETS